MLDDMHMSYQNNEEYIRFSRVEEYQKELPRAEFKLSEVLHAQNKEDEGFDSVYGKGIVMNWSLVPLETQKCHINWRRARRCVETVYAGDYAA